MLARVKAEKGDTKGFSYYRISGKGRNMTKKHYRYTQTFISVKSKAARQTLLSVVALKSEIAKREINPARIKMSQTASMSP